MIAGDGPDRDALERGRRARRRRPRPLPRRAAARARARAVPRRGRGAPLLVLGELPAHGRRGARGRHAGDRDRGRAASPRSCATARTACSSRPATPRRSPRRSGASSTTTSFASGCARQRRRRSRTYRGRDACYGRLEALLAEAAAGVKPRVLFVGRTPLPAAARRRAWRRSSTRSPAARRAGARRRGTGSDPRFRLHRPSGRARSTGRVLRAAPVPGRPRAARVPARRGARAEPVRGRGGRCSPPARRARERRLVVEVHGDWRPSTRLYGSPLRPLLAPRGDRFAARAIRRADAVRALSPFTAGLVRERGRRAGRRVPDLHRPDRLLRAAGRSRSRAAARGSSSACSSATRTSTGSRPPGASRRRACRRRRLRARRRRPHAGGRRAARAPTCPGRRVGAPAPTPDVVRGARRRRALAAAVALGGHAACDRRGVLPRPRRRRRPRRRHPGRRRGRRNGFLVDPGDHAALADALVRILADRGLAERLGAQALGRRRAAGGTPRTSTRRTCADARRARRGQMKPRLLLRRADALPAAALAERCGGSSTRSSELLDCACSRRGTTARTDDARFALARELPLARRARSSTCAAAVPRWRASCARSARTPCSSQGAHEPRSSCSRGGSRASPAKVIFDAPRRLARRRRGSTARRCAGSLDPLADAAGARSRCGGPTRSARSRRYTTRARPRARRRAGRRFPGVHGPRRRSSATPPAPLPPTADGALRRRARALQERRRPRRGVARRRAARARRPAP